MLALRAPKILPDWGASRPLYSPDAEVKYPNSYGKKSNSLKIGGNMSKRNVLLFLPGRSWQAPVGRAGQGRAISLARALRGLPALSHPPPPLGSQATERGTEAASASPQGHQRLWPDLSPPCSALGPGQWGWSPSRRPWDDVSTVGTVPSDLCHLEDTDDSLDGTCVSVLLLLSEMATNLPARNTWVYSRTALEGRRVAGLRGRCPRSRGPTGAPAFPPPVKPRGSTR